MTRPVILDTCAVLLGIATIGIAFALLKKSATASDGSVFFVLYGGGYLLPLIFFALASATRRRLSIGICVFAWLLVFGTAWYSFMLVGLSGLSKHYDPLPSAPPLLAFFIATVIAGRWSFLLFRSWMKHSR
jgi:hypothetical protein